MFKKLLALTMIIGLLAPLMVAPTSAASSEVCKIPRGGDADGNGIGDAGVQVVCNFTAYYAVDANGDWYLDYGDGRDVVGTVSSPAELDSATLEECFYQIHSRGSFEDTPYQDTGEISNRVRCVGPDGVTTYNWVMVASDDPRYTGDPALAVPEFGPGWEYAVNTESGKGNLVVKPQG